MAFARQTCRWEPSIWVMWVPRLRSYRQAGFMDRKWWISATKTGIYIYISLEILYIWGNDMGSPGYRITVMIELTWTKHMRWLCPQKCEHFAPSAAFGLGSSARPSAVLRVHSLRPPTQRQAGHFSKMLGFTTIFHEICSSFVAAF